MRADCFGWLDATEHLLGCKRARSTSDERALLRVVVIFPLPMALDDRFPIQIVEPQQRGGPRQEPPCPTRSRHLRSRTSRLFRAVAIGSVTPHFEYIDGLPFP